MVCVVEGREDCGRGGAKWTSWGSGCFTTKRGDSMHVIISNSPSTAEYLNFQFHPMPELEHPARAKEFRACMSHLPGASPGSPGFLPTLMFWVGFSPSDFGSLEQILGLREVLSL